MQRQANPSQEPDPGWNSVSKRSPNGSIKLVLAGWRLETEQQSSLVSLARVVQEPVLAEHRHVAKIRRCCRGYGCSVDRTGLPVRLRGAGAAHEGSRIEIVKSLVTP